MCGWCVYEVAGCNSPSHPLHFHLLLLPHALQPKSHIYYSPPLKSIDFFRFLGPKRVGLWGWDLLATADAWIQESKSLAEVWRLGLGENPEKKVSGPHQDLFPLMFWHNYDVGGIFMLSFYVWVDVNIYVIYVVFIRLIWSPCMAWFGMIGQHIMFPLMFIML